MFVLIRFVRKGKTQHFLLRERLHELKVGVFSARMEQFTKYKS